MPAQAVSANLDLGVSHARPPADVEAEATSSVLLGGRLHAGAIFASAYGAWTPDPDGASWVSGSLGTRIRAPLTRGFDAGLTATGSAFALGDPTPYRAAVGRVEPELRFYRGGTELSLRGAGGLGRSDALGVLTDLWLYGGSIELGHRFVSLALHVGAEFYEAKAGSYRAASLGSGGALGGARWTLRLRVWDPPGDPELEVSLGLALPLAGKWGLEAAGGRSGPDPLLGSPAAVNGNVLLTRKLIRSRSGPPPVYSVTGGDESHVVFRVERPDAKAVAVTGDFSGWEPIPMERRDGVWTVQVPVEPGTFHFGFLVDGDWYVPEDAPGRVSDDFGRANATLVVPRR